MVENSKNQKFTISARKRIAVVAHNNKKQELIECLKRHREILSKHELYGTGTTGTLVEKELGLPVTKFQSGPLGGDQQLGARIAENQLDLLIFIIDPLDSHPHDSDVKALLRLAQVWNIAVANTIATADFILSSPCMSKVYSRTVAHVNNASTIVSQNDPVPTTNATDTVHIIRDEIQIDLRNPTISQLARNLLFHKC
ncbi:unnamed protein product [Didymodactylos carnosus]|uniref:MGS-like domain-containing protein n=1 Tax=Didymodactylos carnosus TaxID=1234261 RepID=A0A8S2DK20_9BILA|nr:unnamed protein product [Didymodactylos carnosus]CAF3691016.1 unnamed protein product [Didymodactylos carnosus]